MIDFNWGLRWGKLESIGFKFKHGGDPWAYPALEFEELKTLTMSMFTSMDQREYEMNRTPADIVSALNISAGQKEQARDLSASMTDFFKGPVV